MKRFHFSPAIYFILMLPAPAGYAASTIEDLDQSISKQQWSEAVEISDELVLNRKIETQARIKGAYALFQQGYSNSALDFLRKISVSDWKNLPQGQDRFAEIVLLFQKKVPVGLFPTKLEQLDLSASSPYLQTEIRFSKGREAFEKRDIVQARQYLESIPKGSRYYGQSCYLLGALQIANQNYKEASAEFSKVFENSVLEQSSELWTDMSSQMTAHWGANLRVQLNMDSLSEAGSVAELALMGLARSAYATREFETALGYYGKLSPTSKLHARAQLEKIWTLLALNRHDDAQKAAAALAVTDTNFEAFEARPLRALILTDAGRTEEARQEIRAFLQAYNEAKKAIQSYQRIRAEESLPVFLRNDLAADHRLKVLKKYEKSAQEELESLKKEDRSLFPVYAKLVNDISPLVGDAQAQERKLIDDTLRLRLDDLDRLHYQAKLIEIETYLEDRDKLRKEFNNLGQVDDAKQNEHDQRLISLLEKAIEGTDQLISTTGKTTPALVFRQSELLWELSRAVAMLEQAGGQKTKTSKSEEIQRRSLQLEEQVIAAGPAFPRHADALFFNGFAKVELGEEEAGSRVIREYIRLYPKHAHVPDAYRILADISFDKNRFKQAEEDFKKILEFSDSPVVGYALYKIGWCAYNEKSFARSLLAFEKAVLWSVGGAKESESPSLNLRRESKRDLISVYAEVGDNQKASEYFRRFYGGDERQGSKSWLYDLAKVLDTMGQFEKSSAIYRNLAASNPGADDGIAFQTSIIQGSFHLHHWDDVLLSAQQLVDRYHSELSSPSVSPAPSSFAEETLRKIVLARMLESKNEENAQALELTKKITELYLKTFDAWPSSQEPLYRHAQVLFRANQLDEAARAFETHWTKFKMVLQEPLREEALRNLIHALDQNEAKIKEAIGEPTSQAQKLFALCDEYANKYPKTKYTRAITYLKSSVLFKYRRSEDGILAGQELFDANPADDIGKRSFKNLRVAYYEKKDWEKAYHWSTELISRKTPAMSQYFSELKTIRQETLFLLAESTSDHRKAADLYVQLASDPDSADLRVKSFYNAFIQYKKANLNIEALHAAEMAEKTDPLFEGLKQIAGVRAALLQEAGDYERALPLFESFLRKHDASVTADLLQTARFNSGLIAESLGQYPKASTYYREYLKSESATSAASEEVRRGLHRIDRKLSTGGSPEKPFEEPKEWASLLKRKSVFLKEPVPRAGELATKIRKGGEKLESLVKDFAAFAGSEKNAVETALEAYCALPELYDSFGRGVASLAKSHGKEDPELAQELQKVVEPLDRKASELAVECLSKSNEAFHDGALYRWVNAKWGWEANSKLKQTVQRVFDGLQSKAPYFDPSSSELSERQWIERHLGGLSSIESWYALAMSRKNQKKLGLARLTLVDAIAKYPQAPALLNALAAFEETEKNVSSAQLAVLYEKAAKVGSSSAKLNLAVLNFKVGRLSESAAKLKDALLSGRLARDPDTDELLNEMFPPAAKEGGQK